MESTIQIVIGAAAIVAVATLTLLALIVLFKIATGKIDITYLLSNNAASSLSRFQFLIFTFTIAFCYLMILLYQLVHARDACAASTIAAAAKGMCQVAAISLPDGNGAVGLLGISGGGYVLGKAVQTAGDTSTTNAATNAAAVAPVAVAVPVPPAVPAPGQGDGGGN